MKKGKKISDTLMSKKKQKNKKKKKKIKNQKKTKRNEILATNK